MKKLLALLLIFVASCSVQDAYVEADKATYNVIAASYRAYVGTDSLLSADQKNRRIMLLESWRIRIQKAENK